MCLTCTVRTHLQDSLARGKENQLEARMKGNFKSSWGSHKNIRKKFSAMRVVKHWIRLPRDVTDTPTLETFKLRLDRALSNLI